METLFHGLTLRLSPFDQNAGLLRHRRSFTRAGHRREHGDLQPGQPDTVPPAAGGQSSRGRLGFARGKDGALAAFSYPNYIDFRDRNEVLSGLLISRFVVVSMSRNGNNEKVWGSLVSGNYFDVLGVKPALGRSFLPEEDKTRLSHPVVIISHSLWQTRFGGDPSGRRQRRSDQRHEVQSHRRRARRVQGHGGHLHAGYLRAVRDAEVDRAGERLSGQAR